MRTGLVHRRLAACLAVLSLFGWMALPPEHIHTQPSDGHDVDYVHRHLAVHLPDHEDHPDVDHADEAVYLASPAAELTRVELPAPPGIVATVDPQADITPTSHDRLTAPLTVRAHAPPWRRVHSHRGPPAFAV